LDEHLGDKAVGEAITLLEAITSIVHTQRRD